jgi:signal transduction histidine kinase
VVSVLALVTLLVGIARVGIPLAAHQRLLLCRQWLYDGESVKLSHGVPNEWTPGPSVLAALYAIHELTFCMIAFGAALMISLSMGKVCQRGASPTATAPIVLIVVSVTLLLLSNGIPDGGSGWLLRPHEVLLTQEVSPGVVAMFRSSLGQVMWCCVAAALLSGDFAQDPQVVEARLVEAIRNPTSEASRKALLAVGRGVLALLSVTNSIPLHVGAHLAPLWLIVGVWGFSLLLLVASELLQPKPVEATVVPALGSGELYWTGGGSCWRWLLGGTLAVILAGAIAWFVSQLDVPVQEGSALESAPCREVLMPTELDLPLTYRAAVAASIIPMILSLFVAKRTVRSTEQAHLQQWTDRQSQMHRALAAFIRYSAHEIRVPITVLQLGVEALERSLLEARTMPSFGPGTVDLASAISTHGRTLSIDVTDDQLPSRRPASAGGVAREGQFSKCIALVREVQANTLYMRKILDRTLEYNAFIQAERARVMDSDLPLRAMPESSPKWVACESLVEALTLLLQSFCQSRGQQLEWSIDALEEGVDPRHQRLHLLVDQTRLTQALLGVLSGVHSHSSDGEPCLPSVQVGFHLSCKKDELRISIRLSSGATLVGPSPSDDESDAVVSWVSGCLGAALLLVMGPMRCRVRPRQASSPWMAACWSVPLWTSSPSSFLCGRSGVPNELV